MSLIPVTINVRNSLTNVPIADATLSIWTNVLTANVVPNLTTDVNGVVVTSLPQNATYKIFAYKEKVTFNQPHIVTVATTPVTLTMTGSTRYLNEVIKDKVLLYGYIKYLDLSPVSNAKVFIRLSPIPQYEKNLLLSKNDLVIVTNQYGFFSTLLPGDTQVTVSIPEVHFQVTRKLPQYGEVEISDLSRNAE